jgi:hypothetical protein
VEGEELRERREDRNRAAEDRRKAIESRALQDSLMNQYRQDQLGLERERLGRTKPDDLVTIEAKARARATGTRAGAPPRGSTVPRPQYTPIQITRALVNVPLITENNEPIPESQRRALAITWLDEHPPAARRARAAPVMPAR